MCFNLGEHSPHRDHVAMRLQTHIFKSVLALILTRFFVYIEYRYIDVSDIDAELPMNLFSLFLFFATLTNQVSAAEYNDHLTLAVAKQLERPFGGWTPPFRTDDSYGFY